MKIQGLVLFLALGLAKTAVAETGPGSSPELFLPPSPAQPNSSRAESIPTPQSTTANSTAPTGDIELELKQFRNELRDFQATREEVSRSAKTTDADADRISIQQRQELVDLLTKLANKAARQQRNQNPFGEGRLDAESTTSRTMPPTPTAEPVPTPGASNTVNFDSTTEIADPFALGKILFRAGDFVGAERAFRKASVESDNEMTLKYLLATCVRRQSRWKEAIGLYKAVAESNQDPVLRDLAKWQLDNIRWVQESESQLEKLKRQRDKQQKTGNPQAGDARAGK